VSEPKPNGTDLFMAIVSGMSGPKASEGWTRQKLENDITWLASELTRMKDENARLQASLEKSDNLAVKMSDKISSLKTELEASDRMNNRRLTRIVELEDENISLRFEVKRLKDFIAMMPSEVRIKALTELNKGRWDGCPSSDEYIKQMRDVAKEVQS
jgi:septal ring factor EnvC (AmiA/AmiB activator)